MIYYNMVVFPQRNEKDDVKSILSGLIFRAKNFQPRRNQASRHSNNRNDFSLFGVRGDMAQK
jgi:hypothetical protein